MPQISLVGDHGGLEDYLTLTLWWATESSIDYGVAIEAQCLGNMGNTTVSGSTPNGALIHTKDIEYNGANENDLSVVSLFVVSAQNTSVTDMFITGNSAFAKPLDIGGDNISFDRVRIKNSYSSVECIRIATNQPNTYIRNFVASGGTNVINPGFTDGCNITNGVVFGGSDVGYDGSVAPAIHIVTDSFGFNNTTADFISATHQDINTSASEDLTGTYTGYTSAELVDFAGGDYRTKATSALATLGSSGSFIGAFLEASSGISITLDSGSYSVSGTNTNLLHNRSLTANTGSYALTGTNTTLKSQLKIITDSGIYTLTGTDSNILAARKIITNSGTYSHNGTDVTLTLSTDGGVSITLESGTYSFTGTNTPLLIDYRILADTANYTISANEVVLKKDWLLTAETSNYLLTGSALPFRVDYVIIPESIGYSLTGKSVSLIYSGEIKQTIGNVTVGYADNLYNANYKDSDVSVTYKNNDITVRFN